MADLLADLQPFLKMVLGARVFPAFDPHLPQADQRISGSPSKTDLGEDGPGLLIQRRGFLWLAMHGRQRA